jgi:hypothetical protein
LQADLTVPGSFEEAVRGATFVFHTASPFVMNAPHGAEREVLIEPAVKGTENIIGACSGPIQAQPEAQNVYVRCSRSAGHQLPVTGLSPYSSAVHAHMEHIAPKPSRRVTASL